MLQYSVEKYACLLCPVYDFAQFHFQPQYQTEKRTRFVGTRSRIMAAKLSNAFTRLLLNKIPIPTFYSTNENISLIMLLVILNVK